MQLDQHPLGVGTISGQFATIDRQNMTVMRAMQPGVARTPERVGLGGRQDAQPGKRTDRFQRPVIGKIMTHRFQQIVDLYLSRLDLRRALGICGRLVSC